jgi:hypothetical protein
MKHTVRNIGRDAHGTAIPKADFDMVLPHRITIVPVAARELGGQFHGQKYRRSKREQAFAPQFAPPLVNVLPSNVVPPSDIRHTTTLHLSFRQDPHLLIHRPTPATLGARQNLLAHRFPR